MFCRPTGLGVGRAAGATVIFLTSAYDRHAGWGRSTVKMARALAAEGIASLRFDTANVGDSQRVPGRPEQVLYHDTQTADVLAAIDFLESVKSGPVMTAGRCSGAYLGFQASLVDPRIRGNVSVNPAVFHWQEGRSVEEAVVKGTRSLDDYGRRMLNRDTFARVLKGEIDVRAALRNIAKGIGGRIRNRACMPSAMCCRKGGRSMALSARFRSAACRWRSSTARAISGSTLSSSSLATRARGCGPSAMSR